MYSFTYIVPSEKIKTKKVNKLSQRPRRAVRGLNTLVIIGSKLMEIFGLDSLNFACGLKQINGVLF